MEEDVIVSIKACGETVVTHFTLQTKEIAGFRRGLAKDIIKEISAVEIATEKEDKRQAALAREYRRGHRDGRQEAYGEVAKHGR